MVVVSSKIPSQPSVWVNGQRCPFGISIFDTLRNLGRSNDEERLHYHRSQISFTEEKGQLFLEPQKEQASCVFGRARECAAVGSTHCPTTLTTPVGKPKLSVSLAVAGLVFSQDNKMLITRRPSYMRSFPSAWVLPGGSFDVGDKSLEDAVSREVCEETGIISNEWKVESFWESVYPTILEPNNNKIKRHHLVVYLSTKLKETSDNPMLQLCETEVDAAAWLSPENIDTILSESLLNGSEITSNQDENIDIILGNESSTRKESLDQFIGIYPRLSEYKNNTPNSNPTGMAQGSLFALEEYWHFNRDMSRLGI